MKSRRTRAFAELLEARQLLSHPAFQLPTDPIGDPIAAADFNGDGIIDLAAGLGESVAVLLGNGDGTFGSAMDYPIGLPCLAVAGDFNGDGSPDLAAVFTITDPFARVHARILLNRGDGTLANGGVVFCGTGNLKSASAADCTGDGKADLAVLTDDSQGLNVLQNKGNGTFAAPRAYSTNAQPIKILAVDLNGDNKADIACMNGGSVRIFLNKGDGIFIATADYLIANGAEDMALGDFNGDGRSDIAVCRYSYASLLLNNGNGSFAPGITFRTNLSSNAYYNGRIAAGDFNGDGKDDLAAAVGSVPSYSNRFTLVLSNGNGTFGAPIEYPEVPSSGASMLAADFNGDGRTDLAIGGLGILLNRDSPLAPRTDYLGASTRPSRVIAADFTGDGKTDLIVSSSTVGSGLFSNNGNGTFAPFATPTGLANLVTAARDLNGDGAIDVVLGLYSLGVQLNNGNGTFAPPTYYLDTADPYSPGFTVVVADFTGDGKPDIAAWSRKSNSMVILLNNGDGTFTIGDDYAMTGALATADFNADTKADLAVSTASGVRVLLGRGDGTFDLGSEYESESDSLIAADFNGDTKPDLALSVDNDVTVLSNNGDGTFVAAGLYPNLGGSLAAADFNGDGKADLAVADYYQRLLVLLNNGDGTLARPLGYGTGGGPMGLVAADFTGDGKPSLAWTNFWSNSFSVMLNVAQTGSGWPLPGGDPQPPPPMAPRAVSMRPPARLNPRTFYVDANVLGNFHDGTSWDHAYLDLQVAIAAAKSGDEIRVADGTYKPVRRSSSFELKSGVSILGGFAGYGSADPDARDLVATPSILSGDLGVQGDNSDNAYHVLKAIQTDATAVLDGFIVTKGSAVGPGWPATQTPNSGGGGMYIEFGSPTIRDCTFLNNSAFYAGGAIDNESGSPIFVRCTFSGNVAAFGGAIYSHFASLTLDDCVFDGNSADFYGGAIYNEGLQEGKIRGSTFTNNTGSFGGGAIYTDFSSSLTVASCAFSNNSSDYVGGGLANYQVSGTITNCTFEANNAGYYYGGGMDNRFSSPSVIGCTFSKNRALHGGGMSNRSSSSAMLDNCTFSENSATGGGGMYNTGSSPNLTNCIFVKNSASAGAGMNNNGASPVLTNCTFSENTASGYGGAVVDSSGSICSPAFINCTFSANSGNQLGAGGLYLGEGSVIFRDCTFIENVRGALINHATSLTLSNCSFIRNHDGAFINGASAGPVLVIDSIFNGNDDDSGAAMYLTTGSATVINSTFTGNTARNNGGAIFNDSVSLTMINCSLTTNAASSGGAIYNRTSATLVNCILWSNGTPSQQLSNTAGATLNISFSDVEGGWTGTGNINVDPQFDDFGGLRLKATSPCIDAGNNPAVPAGIVTDLAGNPRFVDMPGVNDPGAIVDMGAYEYQFPLAVTTGAYLYDAPQPTVSMTFNGDLETSTLSAGDLILLDPTTNLPILGLPVPTVSYDQNTRTAKWVFATALPDGNYRAKIAAGSVADLYDNALAADFTFDFFVLAGDANRDRTVNVYDLIILATNWLGTGKVFSQADFDYNGVVNAGDLSILGTHWQQRMDLPPTPAVPVAARATRTAIRTPTRLVDLV